MSIQPGFEAVAQLTPDLMCARWLLEFALHMGTCTSCTTYPRRSLHIWFNGSNCVSLDTTLSTLATFTAYSAAHYCEQRVKVLTSPYCDSTSQTVRHEYRLVGDSLLKQGGAVLRRWRAGRATGALRRLECTEPGMQVHTSGGI
jgi:hypothetical protein